MNQNVKIPRKLIEVALPLDAINAAAAREKSIRHGHPSTLHLWWARRPLAAARAVIFAQLVNDPGYQQGDGFKYGVNKEDAAAERKRLFKIIEELVRWENTTNEEVLEKARKRSVDPGEKCVNSTKIIHRLPNCSIRTNSLLCMIRLQAEAQSHWKHNALA